MSKKKNGARHFRCAVEAGAITVLLDTGTIDLCMTSDAEEMVCLTPEDARGLMDEIGALLKYLEEGGS